MCYKSKRNRNLKVGAFFGPKKFSGRPNEWSELLWKFCGDNSSFNQIIEFRKKNITLFDATFQCGGYNI